MFSNEEKISSLADLFREVRDYADLRFRYLRLDFVGKLSELLAALVLGIILAIVVAVALLFFAYTVMHAIAPIVGGECAACAIIAFGCLLIGAFIYWQRRRFIIEPLTGFIARLFLRDKDMESATDTPPSSTDRKEEQS